MIFVCWKWRGTGLRSGTVYTADHVNRLRSMLARHYHGDHQLVCITDDPGGIDSDVRIVPLWDDLAELGRCWRRLKAFSPEMRDVIGPRFAWLDLDCVIVDDIIPLFDRPEPFVVWKQHLPKPHYCGSMLMMDAGARRELWTKFDPVLSPAACQSFTGSDQAWIGYYLGAGQATWTRSNGVLSFRFDCLSKLWRTRLPGMPVQAKPPDGARIVFFHGEYDPSHALVQERCPWVAENWR